MQDKYIQLNLFNDLINDLKNEEKDLSSADITEMIKKLTDAREKLAGGIPVLWLINNDTVDPPWGKVARIKV